MNRPLILCAYASLFALGFSDNIRGPLFPEVLGAFGLSNAVGSWLYALSSLSGAYGAWTCRWWLKRYTRVKTLNLTMLMMSLGVFISSTAPNWSLLLFGAAFTGFAMGLMGVLQNTLVAVASGDAHRTRVLGGLHAMYGISSLLAPLVVAFAFERGGGWRAPYAIVGVFSLIILAWSHFRLKGAEHGSLIHAHELPPRAPVSTKVAVWLAFGLASYVVAEILISSRLALYFRLERSSSLELSSLAVTGFFLSLLVGRLITAATPLKGNPVGPLLACMAASAGLIVVGLVANPWALALTGLTMGPIYPLCVAFFGREFGTGVDSIMSWVLVVQGCLVASMHLSAGWLTDTLGIRTAMIMGPVALGVSLALIGLYGTVFRRHAARI